jgi:hypothetical protein
MIDGQRLYRQGDVLLRPVETIPTAAREVERDAGRIILAHGEVTGHAHAISAPPAEATLLTTDENERFLRLVDDVALEHEEHATLVIPAGMYRVVQQREWADVDDGQVAWRFAGD